MQNKKGYPLYKKTIWLLTVFMFVSFFVFRTYSWGKYLLAFLAVMIAFLHTSHTHWRIRWKTQSFIICTLLFALYCLATAAWAYEADQAIADFRTILDITICFAFILPFYENEDTDVLLSVIKWGGIVVALYTIVYYRGLSNILVAAQRESARIGNTFEGSNALGFLMAITIIIQTYEVMFEGFSWKHASVFLPILIFAAVQSRTAIGLLGAGLLAVFALRNLEGKDNLLVSIQTILSIVVIYGLVRAFLMLPSFAAINRRMDGIIALISRSNDVDGSAQMRFRLIQAGWEQFLRTPIGGIGMGSSGNISLAAVGRYYYLHCNYIELLASGGILGFVIYYARYAYCLYWLIKLRRFDTKHSAICIALIFALLASDIGTVTYYCKEDYFYIMLFFIQAKKLRTSYYEAEK